VRTVILTGVSRGLGAALFDEFNGSGDRILALGRRFTEAQHAAERSAPQRVRLRNVDLGRPETLPAAAELASFAHDASEVVLVHNAAVLDPIGAIGTLQPGEIVQAVAVNLTAPMLLTNALVAAMALRPGASAVRPVTVLYVSSGAAQRTVGGWSVYSSTKHGGEAFFAALAAQHEGDHRVRVANVNPGVMETDMQAHLRDVARRDVYFPDGERYISLYQHGDLVAPSRVARDIIATYLGPVIASPTAR
jgi:NAD(P)-dependent dehydrogenase (short-subunit alcohol dehydrogenase family)